MSGDRQVAVSLYRALRRLALQYDRGPIVGPILNESFCGEHAAMSRNRPIELHASCYASFDSSVKGRVWGGLI
jgi:hypothetical protein